ncbi:hypothetical protein EVAR_72410_1 [Eumeta japonica]|uniref:Uncharacterized protein n=1 Tax=Eumeta variegata TaxID=151549 RepID=A0A4C1T9K9_EUMVA|nr:hypothetical protein EVAR_72410_1 [Eumeta japonica]
MPPPPCLCLPMTGSNLPILYWNIHRPLALELRAGSVSALEPSEPRNTCSLVKYTCGWVYKISPHFSCTSTSTNGWEDSPVGVTPGHQPRGTDIITLGVGFEEPS